MAEDGVNQLSLLIWQHATDLERVTDPLQDPSTYFRYYNEVSGSE